MERAIYYPGFEVQDENWLKFALLYVDKLHPIIPPRPNPEHSETFKLLRDETDLIAPYSPDYQAGEAASLDAIDQVQKVLDDPARFLDVFQNSNIPAKWKNSSNWTYKLYEEKFSNNWIVFCEREGLGIRIGDGMLVEMSLGLLYMSILADIISETENLPSLTDNKEMSNISILTRRAEPLAPQKLYIAQSIIQMQLPARLDQIPLKKVIELRNKPNFKAKVHAFHSELTNHIKDVEDGVADGDFFQTRGWLANEFSDDLTVFGFGLTIFTLGVYGVITRPEEQFVEAVKSIAEAGGLTVATIIGLRTTWEHSKNCKFTRKYLADLARLRPNYTI